LSRVSFDRFCWLTLSAAVVSIVVLLARGDRGEQVAGLGKAAEKEMAYRARIELIRNLYGPIEALRSNGKSQEALLKLDELLRKYPGEAHGYILQGLIQRELGAFDEAVVSLVAGIKLNGDYLDDKSPLSRRAEIERLVTEGIQRVAERAAATSGNRSTAATLRSLNYLKSRLAGGCE